MADRGPDAQRKLIRTEAMRTYPKETAAEQDEELDAHREVASHCPTVECLRDRAAGYVTGAEKCQRAAERYLVIARVYLAEAERREADEERDP